MIVPSAGISDPSIRIAWELVDVSSGKEIIFDPITINNQVPGRSETLFLNFLQHHG
jgi:hypothetical protein